MEQTIDQRRAAHAWQWVKKAAAEKEESKRKDFGRAVMRLPAQIIGSGLAPALAFLQAKGRTPLLLQALGDWVLDKRDNPGSQNPAPAASTLLEKLTKSDAMYLRRATAETLAYLQWLKRFTEAEIGE